MNGKRPFHSNGQIRATVGTLKRLERLRVQADRCIAAIVRHPGVWISMQTVSRSSLEVCRPHA